MGPFVELFQLEEEPSRKESVLSSLEDGSGGFDEVKERKQNIFSYRARVFMYKTTRDAFKMFHFSSQKKKCRFFLKTACTILHRISAFHARFTTLHVEHLFAEM